ncbi:protein-L-isoaspartate O-methyltransferase [Fusobacterium necrophorum subsp. necrophorum]|nr:protein-L-isoaspartate O-methyltransferase [Fusobacterium necrophorum subsp. necrophorum]
MLEVLNPINQYLYTKIEEKDPILLELEAYAQQHKVPIVTKEVAEYLKMMLQLKKCHHALEIGTAIGYSGIYIAREISGTLTTIEIDKNRFEEAKKNFEKAKIFNVNQILGDATEEIKHLDETFDFIFIDASKGQYQNFSRTPTPSYNKEVLFLSIIFYFEAMSVKKSIRNVIRL